MKDNKLKVLFKNKIKLLQVLYRNVDYKIKVYLVINSKKYIMFLSFKLNKKMIV